LAIFPLYSGLLAIIAVRWLHLLPAASRKGVILSKAKNSMKNQGLDDKRLFPFFHAFGVIILISEKYSIFTMNSLDIKECYLTKLRFTLASDAHFSLFSYLTRLSGAV